MPVTEKFSAIEFLKLEGPNPFDAEYVEQELAFWGDHEYVKADRIRVQRAVLQGLVPDYLNEQFRIGEHRVPILTLNNKTWMSLTPMELQSSWVPIHGASGDVGTAGLGMGYYALRVAGMPDVDRVRVYERDHEVIEFFKTVFKDRPELKKIEIFNQDVRSLDGEEFDYFFMDVYDKLLMDEMLDDLEEFPKRNYCGEYRFWTQELVKFLLVVRFQLPAQIELLEKALFEYWQQSEERVALAQVSHYSNDDGWFNRASLLLELEGEDG